ncbi:MAG: hypothetical protein KAG14_00990 [Mycoplasmataceae bacterium]|nr:hypothetical protein [Mycoplasmataceae bacterium]
MRNIFKIPLSIVGLGSVAAITTGAFVVLVSAAASLGEQSKIFYIFAGKKYSTKREAYEAAVALARDPSSKIELFRDKDDKNNTLYSNRDILSKINFHNANENDLLKKHKIDLTGQNSNIVIRLKNQIASNPDKSTWAKDYKNKFNVGMTKGDITNNKHVYKYYGYKMVNNVWTLGKWFYNDRKALSTELAKRANSIRPLILKRKGKFSIRIGSTESGVVDQIPHKLEGYEGEFEQTSWNKAQEELIKETKKTTSYTWRSAGLFSGSNGKKIMTTNDLKAEIQLKHSILIDGNKYLKLDHNMKVIKSTKSKHLSNPGLFRKLPNKKNSLPEKRVPLTPGSIAEIYSNSSKEQYIYLNPSAYISTKFKENYLPIAKWDGKDFKLPQYINHSVSQPGWYPMAEIIRWAHQARYHIGENNSKETINGFMGLLNNRLIPIKNLFIESNNLVYSTDGSVKNGLLLHSLNHKDFSTQEYKYSSMFFGISSVKNPGYYKKIPSSSTAIPLYPFDKIIYKTPSNGFTFDKNKAADTSSKDPMKQLFEFVAKTKDGNKYVIPEINKKILYSSNRKTPSIPLVNKSRVSMKVDIKEFAQDKVEYSEYDLEILKNKTIGFEEFIVSNYLVKDFSALSGYQQGQVWDAAMEGKMITNALNETSDNRPITSSRDKYKGQISELVDHINDANYVKKRLTKVFSVFEYIHKNDKNFHRYFLNSRDLAKFIKEEYEKGNTHIEPVTKYSTAEGAIKDHMWEAEEANKGLVKTVYNKEKNGK